MSTDQTGTEGKFITTKYINLDLNIYDWCSYEGECDHHSIILDDAPECCLLCKYRKLMDLPEIIKKKKLQRKGLN